MDQGTCPVCLYFSNEIIGPSGDVSLFVDWITDRYIELYSDVARRLLLCGHNLSVIDVSQFTYPQQSRSLGRLFPGLMPWGADKVHFLRPDWKIVRWEDSNFTEQDDSVLSQIFSKFEGRTFALSRLTDSILIRWLSSNLYAQLHSQTASGVWIMTNGRLGHQRAVQAHASENNLKTLYLEEIGFPPLYYLEPQTPHDRIIRQEKFKSVQKSLTSSERDLANQWFLERSKPDSVTNPFLRRFTTQPRKLFLDKKEGPVAVLFTSSSDEFVGLGSSWPDPGLSHRYRVLSEIANFLILKGYSLTLRVHPNLKSKSAIDLRAEYLELRKFLINNDVEFFGPESGKNSYDLLDSADLVVVSASTIGIEALHRDKKVLITEPSSYDQLPGVFRIFPHLDEGSLMKYLSEPLAGLRDVATDWIAFQMSTGWRVEGPSLKLPKNSLYGRILYVLNFTFIAHVTTLALSKTLDFLPKRFFLWRISRLARGSASV